MSNGSSRASGVGSGSDVKHGIDDVIEVEDGEQFCGMTAVIVKSWSVFQNVIFCADNAFASEPDSTKILKPSSGCASTNAHPHLESQSSAISNTTASEPMPAFENDSEKGQFYCKLTVLTLIRNSNTDTMTVSTKIRTCTFAFKYYQ